MLTNRGRSRNAHAHDIRQGIDAGKLSYPTRLLKPHCCNPVREQGLVAEELDIGEVPNSLGKKRGAFVECVEMMLAILEEGPESPISTSVLQASGESSGWSGEEDD